MNELGNKKHQQTCLLLNETRLKNRPEHQKECLRCSAYTIAPNDQSGRYILRVSVIFFFLLQKKKISSDEPSSEETKDHMKKQDI
jgi:hypothetical protein